MKQHIDTAPIWDSYKQDCECPLCLLNAKVEASNVDYFLGESVMEPSQRVEVNKKGFCAQHFKMMYDTGNRLGLGLMTHTYMKETIVCLKENAQQLKSAAAAEAGKPIFQRIGSRRGAALTDVLGNIRQLEEHCLMCERIRETMDRYIYTILYMYKHEAEFPALFAQSKGMCLQHYVETLEMAPKHLSGETLNRFINALADLEMENLDRIEGEVEWFTKKFDYRNENKPWGNSRDAVKRAVNKLRHQVIDAD